MHGDIPQLNRAIDSGRCQLLDIWAELQASSNWVCPADFVTSDDGGGGASLVHAGIVAAQELAYPGLVAHDGKVWVSYYSNESGKCAIYFAQLDILP